MHCTIYFIHVFFSTDVKLVWKKLGEGFGGYKEVLVHFFVQFNIYSKTIAITTLLPFKEVFGTLVKKKNFCGIGFM